MVAFWHDQQANDSLISIADEVPSHLQSFLLDSKKLPLIQTPQMAHTGLNHDWHFPKRYIVVYYSSVVPLQTNVSCEYSSIAQSCHPTLATAKKIPKKSKQK
jgi:hypothetical protein